MARLTRRRLVVLLAGLAAPLARAADPPPAPADARRAALVKAGYTPVPLALDPRRLTFSVGCAVGSEKLTFGLDTGSTWTSLDLSVAKRLKLKLGPEAESVGLDGKAAGRWTYVPGLVIDRYDTRQDFPNVPVQAADLAVRPGEPGGVFGIDLLGARAAVVDYSARTLYLRPALAVAWPRLAGTWTVTSWQEDGRTRPLDPKAPPTIAFADRRLTLTDGKAFECGLRFRANPEGDYLLLVNPKDEGKPDAEVEGGGLVKVKNGVMTLCMLMGAEKQTKLPTAFAAPKGSEYVLMELTRTTPAVPPPADPLREQLVKDGYTAVRMDREPNGLRMAGGRVGRHDLRLLVDTATSWSVFDTPELGKWGVERLGEREGHAVRGKVKGVDVNLRGLTLGGYDTRKAWAVVYGGGFDLAGLNKTLADQKRPPIQGLLGNLDLLNGSAVVDFGTDTLYLRPVKETVGPRLAGKWVGGRYEADGVKGRYAPGQAAVEFKYGRVRLTTPGGGTTEWGYHLEDEGDQYRIGLFTPGADELADGFTYAGGGLLRLTDGTLSMVTPRFGAAVVKEPTEFAAPAGSGMLLIEYERAKRPPDRRRLRRVRVVRPAGRSRLFPASGRSSSAAPGSSARRPFDRLPRPARSGR